MPSLSQTALALAGVALLVTGGYATLVGVDANRTSGGTVLVAQPAEESDIDEDDRRVAFENLTESQQSVVRRAIEGERPSVDGDTWPWLEAKPPFVRYQGRYYAFDAVTTECPFPPALVLGAGVLGAALGIGALALAGRKHLPRFEVSPGR